ncbi:hypothetical protein BN1221_03639 [Brenneria goodwinii]|uniref:Uncharacterized protein n=1 Tax=Brenneria goodwinii TaxID=1109412 RepID=A0A0G4JZ74_9GAMM|nr:hypothetical protein BN1221_03639 [Brenneria goodwinii]
MRTTENNTDKRGEDKVMLPALMNGKKAAGIKKTVPLD